MPILNPVERYYYNAVFAQPNLNPCHEITLPVAGQCNLRHEEEFFTEETGVVRKKKKKVIWCRSIEEPFEPAW